MPTIKETENGLKLEFSLLIKHLHLMEKMMEPYFKLSALAALDRNDHVTPQSLAAKAARRYKRKSADQVYWRALRELALEKKCFNAFRNVFVTLDPPQPWVNVLLSYDPLMGNIAKDMAQRFNVGFKPQMFAHHVPSAKHGLIYPRLKLLQDLNLITKMGKLYAANRSLLGLCAPPGYVSLEDLLS